MKPKPSLLDLCSRRYSSLTSVPLVRYQFALSWVTLLHALCSSSSSAYLVKAKPKPGELHHARLAPPLLVTIVVLRSAFEDLFDPRSRKGSRIGPFRRLVNLQLVVEAE